MADPPVPAPAQPHVTPPAGGPASASSAPAAGGLKRPARPPIVLLVGDGEATSDALAASLKQRGLAVMTSPAERAVAAAVARAPDLVLLLGDAAQEGGQRVIKTLASRTTTARLPVAVLEDGDAASLDRRLRALRSGAIAVIERQASVDAMAARIGELAWRVADHSTRTAAGVEVTLDELTAVIRKELGVLVPDEDGQMVAAPGREMAEAIQIFVERIRALVQRGDVEGARAALAARPAHMKLGAEMLAHLDDGATLALRGARVLLVCDDPSRADALAQELRARGSIVVVSGRSERGVHRGRELDPEVVLLDSESIVGPGVDVVQVLARDTRLRWAAVLVMRWDDVWPVGAGVPKMSVIAARVAPHRLPEREIADRVVEEARFDLDVERIGPSRILRALASAPHVLGVTALEDLEQVRVDLANGLVAGATADGVEGLPALAKLLEMSAGVLRIERRRAPSTANVFQPIEDALAMAGRENAGETASPTLPGTTAPGAVRAPIDHAAAAAVAELDAPFAGQGVPAPASAAAVSRPASDFEDTKEVNLAQVDAAPRPATGGIGARPAGVADPIAGGLAALLEPESLAPTPRMKPRSRVQTPPPPFPILAGDPAKRPVRPGTLPGVAPPGDAEPAVAPAVAAEDERGDTTGVFAPGGREPHEAAPVAVPSTPEKPHAAPLPEAVAAEPAPIAPQAVPAPTPHTAEAAPPAHAPFQSQVFAEPMSLGADRPSDPAFAETAAAVQAVRTQQASRSKAPLVLAGAVLLLGVIALIGWRVAGPSLTGGSDAPRTTHVDTHPALHPTIAVPAAQPDLGLQQLAHVPPENSETPTPPVVAPVLPLPANVANDPVAAPPDAGPANAPALAAEEAQALANALDHALTNAAADPDAEAERLTDEASGVPEPARAAAMLMHAAELSPRNPHPVEALARLYLRIGNNTGAVEWAGKLVALRRRRAPFRVLLGDARRAAGDTAGAQTAYREALELDPADRDAQRRLGQ